MLTKSHNCLTELPFLGVLSVTGEGAKKLLQGQFTCDLEELLENTAKLGAQCNPQGRIISLFQVCYLNGQYLLQMPVDLLPIATKALQKYASFYKVTLSDATHLFKQIGYCGPALQNTNLEGLLVIPLIDDASCYEIIGPTEKVMDLQHTLAETTESISETTWKQLKISLGLPTIYAETSEKFLPHEINLPQLNGISFTKGCYTGQEIIARMEYRGKAKKKMTLVEIDSPTQPLRGGDIYNPEGLCGMIVDYCQLGYNKYELLAILALDEKGPFTLHEPDTNHQLDENTHK